MIGPNFPAIVNDALLTASIFTLMVMQILMYVSIKRSIHQKPENVEEG